MSRAYYAMFCAATHTLLTSGLRPRAGFGTWSHEVLPEAVRQNLRKLMGASVAQGLGTRLRHGFKLRLVADYDPAQTVDAETARRCLGFACSVVNALESNR